MKRKIKVKITEENELGKTLFFSQYPLLLPSNEQKEKRMFLEHVIPNGNQLKNVEIVFLLFIILFFLFLQEKNYVLDICFF